PGQPIEFPLAIAGSTDSLSYEWMSAIDSSIAGPVQALRSARPTPPTRPGFYHIVIHHNGVRQVVAEPMLVVMVPFDRKLGQWLNGYLIGEYLAERIGGTHETPRGFVEVHPGMEGFALSTHLTLGDFITHDEQVNVWPKYVAVDPLLLDKLELVLTAIGGTARADVDLDVHSAFRSPAYNRTVKRAARDSRHQYGDAADVQIDANGDGRIDLTDEVLVMLAVEKVEDAHPELVGGLGIYTSRRYRTPYLHIDTRGRRSRWQG
ncbi:MAG: Peptidase, partial [Gemmatimonadetes bacterium]|nr:Peptidase [Gemmatimonadota bacterium]